MKIFEQAQDAIRNFLKTEFSDVDRIFVSKLPDNFKRKSFYIENRDTRIMPLTKFITDYVIKYKIVYFPVLDDSGNVKDFSDLVGVFDKFVEKFPEKTIESPEGEIFNIQEFKPIMNDIFEADVTLEINISNFVKDEVDENVLLDVSTKISIE